MSELEKTDSQRSAESYDKEQLETLDRAAKRLSFMSEASRRLSSALTNQQCFQELLQLLTPRFCDYASITLLTDEGEVKRVAMTHVDPEKEKILKDVMYRSPPSINDSYGTGMVVRTGKYEFDPYLDVEKFLKQVKYPEVATLFRSFNVRSRICVPLKAHGKIFGAFWMGVTADSGRRFTADDLKLAQDLAERAALAIYHLQNYEKASKDLERLKVEREVRETFISQARHDALSILTSASLAAQLVARKDPERFGSLAERIINAVSRAAEVISSTRREKRVP